MPLAFFGTCVANTSTRITEGGRILSANHHQLRCGQTRGSAFHIQLDTPCQHLYIIFLQAFARTVLAFSCTTNACINATLKSFVAHILFI